ncbi:Transmembrane protein [Fasciola gigantica]|uniref:Transmembrane protein n=1 Tax=Fasciola gigantica TaxID=46835 RepID=A0A504YXP6_FASGI|nr:Transmembrane protein [Fasciola gigantica]
MSPGGVLVFVFLSAVLRKARSEVVLGTIISGKVGGSKIYHEHAFQEESFFSKFNFMSMNSSIQFEFAYQEEYEPIRLRCYWDSPIAWVDTFHMRVPCPKKQAILNRLSFGQTIHLDPSMNQWCQKIPLSKEVLRELNAFPFEPQWTDWVSMISSVIVRLSGAIRDAKDWLDPLASLITPNAIESSSSVAWQDNRTRDEALKIRTSKGLELVEVVQMAWNNHMKKSSPEKLSEMTNWIYCKSPEIDLQFSRAAWWFFSVERCKEEPVSTPPVISRTSAVRGIEAAYKITLRNGPPGDLLREHFSAEKFGNLEMDMVFVLLFGTLQFFAVIITYKLYKSRQLHPTVLLWLFSIVMRCATQLLRCIIGFYFAAIGIRSLVFDILIQLLYSTSTSALFAGLLLLSSGYTIVHRVLSRTLTITLYIFLGAYILVNLATQITIVILETQGDVLSRYHSKASSAYVSLQLTAWVGFCVSCAYTLFSWSQKRLFFIRLVAIFSLWFWNIPLWTFVTMSVTHKRFTENLIRVWDELITVGAYVILLLILRPENANTVFPFHLSHTEATSREVIIPPEKPTKTEKKLPSLLAPIRSTESPVLPRSRPRTPEPPPVKMTGKAASPRKPLPEIGGKPGDIPGPGFTLYITLA